MVGQGIALSAVLAFTTACLLTYLLARPGAWLQILDHPNERSLHDRAISRTGGLAVLAGLVVSSAVLVMIYGSTAPLGAIAAWLGVIAAVSLADDRFDLSPMWRLVIHFAAAIALILAGLRVDAVPLPGMEWPWPASVSAAFSVVFVVWIINLYNFMDGMDGFAGGMAAIGFGIWSVLGWSAGAPLFAGLAVGVAASAVGFLVWNFPPARIFLGDAGSSALGFLVAAFALWADVRGIAPLWASVLIFSPFVVDATVTVLRRLGRGEPVWRAHRKHYYQRLVRSGWGHRRTVLWEYALMLACGASALVAVTAEPIIQWLICLGWVAAYGALLFAIERRIPFPENT